LVQRRFAITRLQALLEHQEDLTPTGVISYGWVVSSLEVLDEKETLGSGTFGTVHTGRWNGTRVAIKQLPKSAPKKVGNLPSFIPL
jgi:hypothetical protein